MNSITNRELLVKLHRFVLSDFLNQNPDGSELNHTSLREKAVHELNVATISERLEKLHHSTYKSLSWKLEDICTSESLRYIHAEYTLGYKGNTISLDKFTANLIGDVFGRFIVSNSKECEEIPMDSLLALLRVFSSDIELLRSRMQKANKECGLNLDLSSPDRMNFSTIRKAHQQTGMILYLASIVHPHMQGLLLYNTDYTQTCLRKSRADKLGIDLTPQGVWIA